MSELIPAATAILVRDSEQGLEVLLLRRSSALSFAAGCWVFPGGRIDSSDYPSDNNLEAAAKHAAVRETAEETQLKIDVQALIPASHWTPPKGLARRFSTWFFITHYRCGEQVQVDNSEIDDYRWLTPQNALADLAAEKISMMPPTYVTLVELSACGNAEQALKLYQNRRPINYAAKRWHKTEAGGCALYEGDAGYETDNPDADGPRHRLWQENGRWRYEIN